MDTTQVNAGTLATPLQSAAFVPMDSIKGKSLSAGNRWCKLIKKGENSRLPESLAVEVPSFSHSLASLEQYPALVDYLQASMDSLINSLVKARAEAGALSINYAELAIEKLAEFAAAENASNGIGHMSEERIKSWFENDARELLLVALADRLGVSETATAQDVTRLEQIANQTRDNLAKLSSKKPVQFDERVKNALNWALDVTDTGDTFTVRMRDKLNAKVDAIDLGAALGF
jgi:hypothetical protein